MDRLCRTKSEVRLRRILGLTHDQISGFSHIVLTLLSFN
jgi:hypothetical protein